MTFTCNLVIVLIAALRSVLSFMIWNTFWELDLIDRITDITHPNISHPHHIDRDTVKVGILK